MEEKIVITPTGNELHIRQGKLPDIVTLKPHVLENVFLPDFPSYVAHRMDKFGATGLRQGVDPALALIVAEPPTKSKAPVVTLNQEPGNPNQEIVRATVEYSEQLKLFSDASKKYNREEFVRLIRYNVQYIPDHQSLLTKVRTFIAEVQAWMKQASDNRGNRTAGVEKKVTTELPEQIKVEVPIFSASVAKVSAWAELCVDVSDSGAVMFWFESPELEVLAEDASQNLLIKVISDLKELSGGLNIVTLNG